MDQSAQRGQVSKVSPRKWKLGSAFQEAGTACAKHRNVRSPNLVKEHFHVADSPFVYVREAVKMNQEDRTCTAQCGLWSHLLGSTSSITLNHSVPQISPLSSRVRIVLPRVIVKMPSPAASWTHHVSAIPGWKLECREFWIGKPRGLNAKINLTQPGPVQVASLAMILKWKIYGMFYIEHVSLGVQLWFLIRMYDTQGNS